MTPTNEVTIEQRMLTPNEVSRMRRAHWVLVPTLLVVALVIVVLMWIDDLPIPAKIAGYVLAVGALLVMSRKQYLLEKELRNGKAKVVRGVVQDKYKFGGGTSPTAGGGSSMRANSKTSGSSATYILVIGGEQYWVKSKIWMQAEKGKYSEMVWLPVSQYVVSIKTL